MMEVKQQLAEKDRCMYCLGNAEEFWCALLGGKDNTKHDTPCYTDDLCILRPSLGGSTKGLEVL